MNKQIVGSALTLVLLASLATSASAEPQARRIDAREARQERRIERGVATGALTAQEAMRLDRGQARVDRIEDLAMSDGTLTARERLRIEQQQDVQSRHIDRQKHDRQTDYDLDGRNDRVERAARRGAGRR